MLTTAEKKSHTSSKLPKHLGKYYLSHAIKVCLLLCFSLPNLSNPVRAALVLSHWSKFFRHGCIRAYAVQHSRKVGTTGGLFLSLKKEGETLSAAMTSSYEMKSIEKPYRTKDIVAKMVTICT